MSPCSVSAACAIRARNASCPQAPAASGYCGVLPIRVALPARLARSTASCGCLALVPRSGPERTAQLAGAPSKSFACVQVAGIAWCGLLRGLFAATTVGAFLKTSQWCGEWKSIAAWREARIYHCSIMKQAISRRSAAQSAVLGSNCARAVVMVQRAADPQRQ